MEPRNRIQGMNFASLCSLAGRYDNPIPTRFLAPIDCLKIPPLAGRHGNPIPTRFLASEIVLKFQPRKQNFNSWKDVKTSKFLNFKTRAEGKKIAHLNGKWPKNEDPSSLKLQQQNK